METPDIKGHARHLMQWMLISLFVGLALGATGLYLLAFTDFSATQGVSGIVVVVTLISLGLLLIVPAKIYIILRFTRSVKNPTQVNGAQDKA